jgi:hypothetical protein
VLASGTKDAHKECCGVLPSPVANNSGYRMVTTEEELTRLESELSFLQVKATMTLQERIRQVKAKICENRRQIVHVRLESIAGAENPYSLMQVFGRGHQVTKKERRCT